MRFVKRYIHKNDIKAFKRCLNDYCLEKHAVLFLRDNRIVSVVVELLIDISDDIFSSEYVRYIFNFNNFSKDLYKLLSIHSFTTEYHVF